MQNRTLKFRIYDKGRNEWVHGPGSEVNLFGECILCGELLRRDSDDTHVKLQDLNDIVALQYTGLKDKAGVEIYEGDIIEWDYEYDSDYDGDMPIVRRSAGRAEIKDIFDRHNIITAAQESKGCWVIGSIYSNPELLKK